MPYVSYISIKLEKKVWIPGNENVSGSNYMNILKDFDTCWQIAFQKPNLQSQTSISECLLHCIHVSLHTFKIVHKSFFVKHGRAPGLLQKVQMQLRTSLLFEELASGLRINENAFRSWLRLRAWWEKGGDDKEKRFDFSSQFMLSRTFLKLSQTYRKVKNTVQSLFSFEPVWNLLL